MKRIDVLKNLQTVSKNLNSEFFASCIELNSKNTIADFYEELLKSKSSYDKLSSTAKEELEIYGLDLKTYYEIEYMNFSKAVAVQAHSNTSLKSFASVAPLFVLFIAKHKAFIETVKILNHSLANHQELYLNGELDLGKANKNLFIFTIYSQNDLSFNDFADIISTLHQLIELIKSLFEEPPTEEITITLIDSGSAIDLYLKLVELIFISPILSLLYQEVWHKIKNNLAETNKEKIIETLPPNPNLSATENEIIVLQCIDKTEKLINKGAMLADLLNKTELLSNQNLLTEHLKPKELKRGN